MPLSHGDAGVPPRVGGLLAAYLVVLVLLVVHGLWLTVAAVVVNANPGIAGLDEPLPWSSVGFYVGANVFLALYSLLVVRLVLRRRRSAVVHNAVWAVLTALCLVAWHFLGMKSPVGVVVDSLPGLVGVVYFARSKRVKLTLRGGTRRKV